MVAERSSLGHGPALPAIALLLILLATGLGAGHASTAPDLREPHGAPALPSSIGEPMGAASTLAAVPPFPTVGPIEGSTTPSTGGVINLTFTAQPVRGSVPLTTTLNAMAFGSPAANKITFVWTFGDGSPVVTAVADVYNSSQAISTQIHPYRTVGTFTLALKVSDDVTDTPRSLTQIVLVTAPLLLSQSISASSVSGGRPVVLTVTPSGGLAPYTFNFTNDTGSHPTNCLQVSSKLTCTEAGPTGPAPTTYHIHVAVSDAANNAAATSFTFNVTPRFAVTEGLATWYTCNGSLAAFHAVYTANLSAGTTPYSFFWDFGDGTSTATALNGTHTFPIGAGYTVTFVANDSSGATASRAFNVSTAYPSCAQIAPPSYAPPLVFLEASAAILAGIVTLLAIVLVVGIRAAGAPPASPSPLSRWDGPAGGSTTPVSPPASNAPPPGAQ